MLEVAAKAQADIPDIYGIGVRGSRSLGDDPPGLPVGLCQFRPEGPERHRRGQAVAAMNTDVSKMYHRKWVEMIQNSGRIGLVDPHLVPSRHRPRRGQVGDDLRRRHPGLLPERRDRGGRANLALRAVRRQSGGRGATPKHLDLVAGDVELLAAQGRRLALPAVGLGAGARACSARPRWTSSNPVRKKKNFPPPPPRRVPWADEMFREKLNSSYPA